MLKGQNLDVWLDKMVETSKGYENEITQMSVENLDGKSWVKQSKRSLEITWKHLPRKIEGKQW